MNGRMLLEALGQVEERYLEEADEPGLSPSRRIWLAAAACLCLMITAAVLFASLGNIGQQDLPSGEIHMAQAPTTRPDPGSADGIVFTEETAEQLYAGASSTEPVIATEAPLSPADGGANPGPAEMPAVILRITGWVVEESEQSPRIHCLAEVDTLVDTDLIPKGTKVKVVFLEECYHAVTAWENAYQILEGAPTAEDCPEGSRIEVQFTEYRDGILYVDMVYLVS